MSRQCRLTDRTNKTGEDNNIRMCGKKCSVRIVQEGSCLWRRTIVVSLAFVSLLHSRTRVKSRLFVAPVMIRLLQYWRLQKGKMAVAIIIGAERNSLFHRTIGLGVAFGARVRSACVFV